MDRNETPPWADRLLLHLRGAELLGLGVLVLAAELAALIVVIWAVVGVITGFVPLNVFVGVGGAGGAGVVITELIRKHQAKP